MGQHIQSAKMGKKRKKHPKPVNQPGILYPAKLSFKIREKLRHPQINKKLRDFVTNRFALQEMLKGVLQGEMKGH